MAYNVTSIVNVKMLPFEYFIDLLEHLSNLLFKYFNAVSDTDVTVSNCTY